MTATTDDGRDRLARVLHTLRMRSTFCCQTEVREPWSLEMPSIADSVSFHVVTAGSMWLRLPGTEAVELRAGDLALVPHGLGHDLLGSRNASRGPRVDLLEQEYLTPQYSRLRYGGQGRATQLICGIVSFDDPASRELMRALPDLLHIDGDTMSAASPVRDLLRLIAEELTTPQAGGGAVATRLADVLVIHAIRAWLSEEQVENPGWLRALQDPRIGRVLEAIHHDPGRDWDLRRLAQAAAMSRSSFSARFTELAGTTPVEYLTRWRMSVAHSRLLDEDVSVARLAGDLGYGSEAAFTRAFGRVIGRTPGQVRRTAAT
ncbi:AraC family transcriptional regulator [Brevibacterium spongiae]|uniref:AraC family transcriptional regulator n=1 Tax=Brevibacterium spongiae TaxID=2909672 RepID=A0ABY5SPY6_9MICO|nr:AraC family transcriptional regulator [Brevibacterium spongiae]UVI36598.1 AraC family transcriptional regulator [Brevibacterium spongiae]